MEFAIDSGAEGRAYLLQTVFMYGYLIGLEKIVFNSFGFSFYAGSQPKI